MSSFLEIFAVLALTLVVFFLAACAGTLRSWYRKALQMKCGAVFNFDTNIPTTTKLPVSVRAATCEHNWETLDKSILQMPHEQKYICINKCGLCGVIDKTVEVTSKMPPPQPLPPCKHQWETVDRTKLEAPHESKISIVLKCVSCGEIDKTVEVTSKPPVSSPGKSECRHKWSTEKSVTLDSAYEQMLKSIKKPGQYGGKAKVDPEKSIDLDLNEAPKWMFRKTYVEVRTCSLCGEIDKLIANNIEESESDELE